MVTIKDLRDAVLIREGLGLLAIPGRHSLHDHLGMLFRRSDEGLGAGRPLCQRITPHCGVEWRVTHATLAAPKMPTRIGLETFAGTLNPPKIWYVRCRKPSISASSRVSGVKPTMEKSV